MFVPAQAISAERDLSLGVGAAYTAIRGDLDEIDPGPGFLVFLENKFKVPPHLAAQGQEYRLQLSYQRTEHHASTLLPNGEVINNALHLGMKFCFLADQPTRPYLIVGFGYHILDIEAGAINLVKLYGLGYNFGAGVDYYLNPSNSIGAGLTYQLIHYNEAAVQGSRDTLGNGPDGSHIGLILTGAYHFY